MSVSPHGITALAVNQKAGCMNRRINSLVLSVIVSCLFTTLALGQVTSGQKVETKGLIVTREGENFTMNSPELGKIVVVLTDNTKVQVPKGLFRNSDIAETSLVPGLEVEVKGAGGENGQVVADSVRFNKESLRIANQVQAGLTATKAQAENNKQNIENNKQNIEENQKAIGANASNIAQNTQQIQEAEQRFSDLTEFDVKKELAINFETGKTSIPPDSQQQLIALANEAKGMKGYVIDIKGFASTSGSAGRNQQLSEDRAQAVVTVLHQQGVPLKNIVTPGAMGTTGPVASNDTQAGRLQNQRVEVKVLVNRSLAKK
jgi:OmpA-OmpF porin, OOP family